MNPEEIRAKGKNPTAFWDQTLAGALDDPNIHRGNEYRRCDDMVPHGSHGHPDEPWKRCPGLGRMRPVWPEGAGGMVSYWYEALAPGTRDPQGEYRR